uniref:Major facilitator superfamily (MFS) profile domain-containing protein n=1 Tax=Branchiostoma floridae TaxID=7739 RepID=C3ZI27_BRAFL|eukprot:XP_002591758.1 hypothetical protein BRAFLDRAFT_83531 [Branchiostoma floridae]
MSTLGFLNAYTMRVNLTIALVAMVNHTQQPALNGSEDCIQNVNITHDEKPAEFGWDATTQNTILGAFYYGYIFTQIPAGWLAGRFGGKLVFGLGILFTAVFTLLTPLAARTATWLLIAVRVAEGLAEGVLFPAMHAMWRSWAPPIERSKLVTISLSGTTTSTPWLSFATSVPVWGLIITHICFNWGTYTLSTNLPTYMKEILLFDLTQDGFLSALPYLCMWLVQVLGGQLADKLREQQLLSTAAVRKLFNSLGKLKVKSTFYSLRPQTSEPAPRGALHAPRRFGSLCCYGNRPFGRPARAELYRLEPFERPAPGRRPKAFEPCRPGPVRDVVRASPSGQSGPFMAVRTVLRTVERPSRPTDPSDPRTIAWFELTVHAGMLLQGVFLVLAGYVSCHQQYLGVLFLTVGIASSGLGMSGFQINHLDIAPRHAGVLMGITNCIATVPGFAGPAVVGFLTKYAKTWPSRKLQWQKVFYIAGGIYAFGTLTFLLMGRGTVQEWAKEESEQGHKSTQKCLLVNQDQTQDDTKIVT